MEKWRKFFLQRYLGCMEERDEYQQTKINEVLATSNMINFGLLTIAMMISIVWDALQQQISLGTFLLFIVQQVNSIYIMNKIKKYQMLKTEFYDRESFDEAIKQAKRQAILSGIQWGIFMLIFNHYIFPALMQEPANITWFHIFVLIITSSFFGTSMYFVCKHRFTLCLHELD